MRRRAFINGEKELPPMRPLVLENLTEITAGPMRLPRYSPKEFLGKPAHILRPAPLLIDPAGRPYQISTADPYAAVGARMKMYCASIASHRPSAVCSCVGRASNLQQVFFYATIVGTSGSLSR